MAEHPLRAILLWPVVLGVGLVVALLFAWTVVGAIAFLIGLADQDIEADLDDEEYADA